MPFRMASPYSCFAAKVSKFIKIKNWREGAEFGAALLFFLEMLVRLFWPITALPSATIF